MPWANQACLPFDLLNVSQRLQFPKIVNLCPARWNEEFHEALM